MTAIIRRGIANDAVGNVQILLDNNGALRSLNSSGVPVDLFKLTSADKFEFQQLPTVNSGLSLPSAPNDLVTVDYVTKRVLGKVDAKDAVNLAATANVPLTGSTPLTIDGTTATDGMRILLPTQTTGTQNGVYDLTITGGTYALTRSSDFDQVSDPGLKEVTTGAYFKIVQGTTYSGWEAILTNSDPIVIGTTVLSFVLNPTVQALTAGDGLKKVSNDISIDIATNQGLMSTNPGQASGQIAVKFDQATLEKDKSTRADPTTGAVMARMKKTYSFTLTSTDITNGYVDLADVAGTGSITFNVAGFAPQIVGTDCTVNYTGGTGGKTRITFAGQLVSGGAQPLVAGDVVFGTYTSF